MTTKFLTGTYAAGYVLHLPVTTVTVASTGVILFQGVVGETTTANTVVNVGRITATASGSRGVYLGDGGSVTNGSSTDSTAMLNGAVDGVEVLRASALVTNYGTVQSTTGTLVNNVNAAVYLGAGGAIINGSQADTKSLIAGDVGGVVVTHDPGTVINFGTINVSASGQPGSVGVYLMVGGSVTNGSIDDRTALISGFEQGISANHPASVVNFGSIDGGVGMGGGMLTNGAPTDVTAYVYDVRVGGGAATIINYGTMRSADETVGLDAGGVVINGGTNDTAALISGANAIYFGAPGSVANFGTITGGGSYTDGIGLRYGGSVTNGSVSDQVALIQEATGVSMLHGVGRVTNFGVIDGNGADYGNDGIALGEGGNVTNGGSADHAALIEGYSGVQILGAVSDVTNYGTINALGVHRGYAVVLEGGGTVTNGSATDSTSLMESVGGGILVADVSGSIVNFGTILVSGAGAGAFLSVPSHTGLIANGSASDANALIQGYSGLNLYGGSSTNFGVISGVGALGFGIETGGGAVVTNGAAGHAGALIQGDIGVYVEKYTFATVTNFGTIKGTGGDAVVFAESTGLLNVEAGSAFIGVVEGGGGTLNLATGVGMIGSLIGGDLTVSGSMPTATLNNFGTVEIAAGAQFTLTGPGTIAVGGTTALVDAGELTVTGGLVVAGTLSGAGEVLFSGGASSLGAGAVLSVAKAEVAGASTSIAVGTNLAYAGAWSQSGGTVSVGAGDVLTFTGASDSFAGTLAGAGTAAFTAGTDTITGATLSVANLTLGAAARASLGGVIDLSGKISSATTNLSIAAGGATLSGGGALVLAGGVVYGADAGAVLTNAGDTISGTGDLGDGKLTVVNQAAGIIDASAASWLVLYTGAATITNTGLIEATGAGGLSLRSTVNNAGGGRLSAAGGDIYLEGADIQGGALSATDGKVIYAKAGVDTLDGTASGVNVAARVVIENGENLNLLGAIDNTSLIQLVSDGALTTLTIGSAGATLTGGGQVFLGNDNAAAKIIGASASATLDNTANVIAGAGDVGGGELTLVNGAAGVIVGEYAVALIVDTGANTIVNAGRIENSGKGGTLVKSAVVNTGGLIAEGGTLTLDGAVTGSGEALIYSGTLDFASSFSQLVAFKATTGVLELAQSQSYAGTVYGFSTTGGTSLDLGDITYGGSTTASYSGTASGGTLTVTDGTHTAKIKLVGDYLASTFTASSDGHGGTTIVDPPKDAPAAPPHAFIAAMAGFGAPAGAAIHTHDVAPVHAPMLARPRTMTA